jgi:uncharacterized membrane protein YjjP (DUF1212 family)
VRKKKKAHARRKLAKLQAVPKIDPSIPISPEDPEEGGLHAVRSYDSLSSEAYGLGEYPSESDSNLAVEPTEEIPTDTNEQIYVRLPKRTRSKRSNQKQLEEAEQGDDEKGGDEDSGDDSAGEEVAPSKGPGNQETVAERGDTAQEKTGTDGDVVIPMEGEGGIPRPSNRLARFKLQRGAGQDGRGSGASGGAGRSAVGSRFFWGGGMSSFEEDSQPETMELTPLELARIHASMRRTRTGEAVVPGIYDRPRNVLEAALIPNEVETTANGDLVGVGERRSKTTSKATDTEVEMEELGKLDEPHDFEPPVLTLVPKYPLEELIPFLTLLAKTFHAYGAPVNRTEWNMREVSETLGVLANFAVMPTQITITFGLPEGMDAVSRTFRCDQNLVECGRLFLVEKLINKLRLQQVDLYQGRDELQAIINRPPNFSLPIQLLSFCVASASSAVLFFNGGWAEFIIAGILGLVVALLNWASEYSLALARVMEIIAALIVAAVAVTVTYYVPGSCFSGLVLSSLVWCLPGLTLTFAIRELATKNMIAGTVRMFSAFMTALKLGFGISFGSYIPFWIPKGAITTACAAPLSQWWYILFFFTTVIPFNILLDTTFHQWPGQLATSGIGFIISWAFSRYANLPSELISALAAFGVGLVGNGYALWSKSSGVVYIVSGILLLVPGSVGVKGATAFFDKDAWSGLQFSFTMVIIGFSITVGTLIADLLIFPRREFIHFAF